MSVADDVPIGVVTVTATGPTDSAGAVTLQMVSVQRPTIVAAVDPKSTAVALLNPDPVIVTDAPPAVVPIDGDTEATTGGVAEPTTTSPT